ncbi:hypothetical protein [uncultured Methanospirillum sp.]|uniref:hypothetical protein n=1 Tax=uncultured Methanospirillum sp. TaxID=262503 RepID=UPI0029C9A5D3|nr:hypothetical protein [uncultured Methanospirillum sp.]
MAWIIWASIIGSIVVADIEDDIQEPPNGVELVSQEQNSPTSKPIPSSNVTDWNPYEVLPPWKPPLNHSSILKQPQSQTNLRTLNTSYSGSVDLNASAIGKELNITNGPFSITYTVHPTISSPRDVWVKITIFDPWEQVITDGGYNRGFPSEETQTMKIYREGRYYMSIEGEFASMDYTIKTADPVPVVSSVPTHIPDRRFEEDGEMA